MGQRINYEQALVTEVTAEGEEAFWEAVAGMFPTVKTGDFSPDAQRLFHQACQDAVRTWIAMNVKTPPHYESGTEPSDEQIRITVGDEYVVLEVRDPEVDERGWWITSNQSLQDGVAILLDDWKRLTNVDTDSLPGIADMVSDQIDRPRSFASFAITILEAKLS